MCFADHLLVFEIPADPRLFLLIVKNTIRVLDHLLKGPNLALSANCACLLAQEGQCLYLSEMHVQS